MSPELQFVLALCALAGTYYQRSTRDEVRALRDELEDLTNPNDGVIADHEQRLYQCEEALGLKVLK